jgi:protein-arginine kinase activator protein McsA
MTIVAQWKICPKCKKKYSWNPDVGKIGCPRCGTITDPFGNIMTKPKRKFPMGGKF